MKKNRKTSGKKPHLMRGLSAQSRALRILLGCALAAGMLFACGNPAVSSTREPGKTDEYPDKQQIIEIKITSADSRLYVEWNRIDDADNYELYLDGKLSVELKTNYAVIKELINDQAYFIQIRALGQNLDFWSKVETGTPASGTVPPLAPLIKVIRDNCALIPFWEPVQGAVSYEVFLNDALFIETEEPRVTISELTNGVEYTIKVRAKNHLGISPYSNVECTAPDRYIRTTNIGRGFNLLGSLNTVSVSSHQILDQDKLNADGLIIMTDETKTVLYAATGEQMREVQMSMNKTLGMIDSEPFKVITFSGGISSAFGKEDTENDEYKYANLRGEHYIKMGSLASGYSDVHLLKNYFSESFLHALKNDRPSQFFQNYGHALLISHYLGGSREMYYKYYNKKNISLDKFRVLVNSTAGLLGEKIAAETKLEPIPYSAAEPWEDDCEITGRYNGGNFAAYFSTEQFYSDYLAWVLSVSEKPVFAGVPNYGLSFIPVWKIAEAFGEYDAADKLHTEFINQAYHLAGEFEILMPGEWFSKDGEVHDAVNTFFRPKQYAAGEHGELPTPVKYIVSLTGGGGGGQGYGRNQTTSWPGGGGGSGSAAYLTFMTDENVSIDIIPGMAGQGSNLNMNTWALEPKIALPGYNGGFTCITWNGVTVKTGGGMGGGFGDGSIGDTRGGAGGTASISGLTNDIITRYRIKYILQDGNAGQAGTYSLPDGGDGGTAVCLKNFVGSSGGRGGILPDFLYGVDGEEGKNLIQFYSYRGE